MAAIVTGSRWERCILVDPFSRRPNGETLIYARRVRCANRGQRQVMCDETSCALSERKITPYFGQLRSSLAQLGRPAAALASADRASLRPERRRGAFPRVER